MAFVAAFVGGAMWVLGATTALDLPKATAGALLIENPLVIRAGYAEALFPFQGILWLAIIECEQPRFDVIGTETSCLACSIDDTSGQTYSRTDIPVSDWILPSTAVGIMAARADFVRRPEGWSLKSYRPLAINYYSVNREPYHRANLDNLAREAPQECRELRDAVGDDLVVRGRRAPK